MNSATGSDLHLRRPISENLPGPLQQLVRNMSQILAGCCLPAYPAKMPARRMLPDTATLVRWVDAGMTHQQIADEVERVSGEHVSRSTVSAALSRAGLSRQTHRYDKEIPWRVRVEHMTEYPARMLRLLGRRRAGLELTNHEAERLDSWLEGLAERNLVVAYCSDAGFLYVDADEVGDGARGIPIRRREILAKELA